MISLRWAPFRPFASKQWLLLLWLFLLVFPKGGIKLGPAPVTWGYLFLTLLALLSFARPSLSCTLPRIYATMALLPFQAITLLIFALNGIASPPFAVAQLLAFFFLPWTFFLLFSRPIEQLDLTYLSTLLRKGIFFIAAYGIFLFFYKFVTGKFLEIPFLTVNFHDLGSIENKHINRGLVFKLISTYNNGNLYGICLLIFLPLYLLVETTSWRRWLIHLSLLLTLSRTVWLGLLFSHLLTALLSPAKRRFLLRTLFAVAVLGVFFAVIAFAFQFPLSFFFDRNLGGRIGQLQLVSETGLFSKEPFLVVFEMTYLGVLWQFGWLGLFFFLVAMGAPLFLARMYSLSSPVQKALACGLINYLFIATADGALLLIPVLAFYWFASSLLLRRNFSLESS